MVKYLSSQLATNFLLTLFGLNRAAKRLVIVLADILVITSAYFLAAALLTTGTKAVTTAPAAISFIPFAAVVILAAFAVSGQYNVVIRHISVRLIIELFAVIAISVFLISALDLVVTGDNAEPVFLFVFASFALPGAVFIRLAAQFLVNQSARFHYLEPLRIMIFGAGRAGTALYFALLHQIGVKVVGFIDEDPELAKQKIDGIRIFSVEDLDRAIPRLGVDEIIFAIPRASSERRAKILNDLARLAIQVRVLPSVGDLIGGRFDSGDIRDVQAGDLLWRPQSAPIQKLLESDIKGKRVMVTGGAGSIGSELCRQILQLSVEELIVFDHAEYALYIIERELSTVANAMENPPTLRFVLSDIKSADAVNRILDATRPETIYHAAAYKHVPIVEENAASGVANNVRGTLNLAVAAGKYCVDKFILISTDKAVRPPNIMGASKRFSELILQALDQAQKSGNTIFSMVRFGNVLDSAGSVVPLFKKQISEGGPVTVTHRDVTRYFMTIPEAAQLVLQAGAMATGGEVFLLEMGEPVRIYDLALRLIGLSGKRPKFDANSTDDIEIEFTGLRAGEKLHEELLINADASKTAHPAIKKAQEKFIAWDELERICSQLVHYSEVGDENAIRQVFSECVEGFEA